MAEKTQRHLDPDYLYKRSGLLEQFLENVIESDDLKSSLALLCFLKCNQEEQWTKIKEELDKCLQKTSVGQVITIESADSFLKEAIRRKNPTPCRRYPKFEARDRV
jgi:hypothetical protein